MVCDVYARYICDNNIGKVTVISVGMNHPPKNKLPYDIVATPYMNGSKVNRILQRLIYGGRLFSFSRLRKVVDENLKTCLFVFNDNEPITNKLLRIVKSRKDSLVCLVDEGIGSYADSNGMNLSYKQKLRWLFTSMLGSPMQFKAIGDNPLIDVALVSNKELYTSLNKAANQKVFFQDKGALYARSDMFLKDYYSFEKQGLEYDVVFLGQPFYENSGISRLETDYICHVFEMIPSNLRIVVKPHPRDPNGKYDFLEKRYKNVTIISKELAKLPLECLTNFIGAKMMIGHNSSALVNIANTFPGIVCCLTYRMSCAEAMHKVWMDTYSYSSYDDTMYSSINNNLLIPNNDLEFKAVFNRHISSAPIIEQVEDDDYIKLLTYCIEMLNEGESKHGQNHCY